MTNASQTRPVIEKGFWAKTFFGVTALATICLIGAGIIYHMILQGQDLGPNYGATFKALSGLRHEILVRSFMIYGVGLLCAMVGIAVIAVLYSHRIAGPVFRLGVFLDQVAKGHLDQRLRFRKKDVVHVLADEINGLLERYSADFTLISSELHELKRILESLRHKTISPEDAQSAFRRISKRINEIEKAYKL